MKNYEIRQGDVYIFQVDKLPDDLIIIEPSNNQNLLALGESTGHAHATKADESLFYSANDNLITLAKENGLSESRNVVGALRVIVEILITKAASSREVKDIC